jgi:hypothetical protein
VGNRKKYWLLVLGLTSLLLGFFVACGKPGYIKYTNDQFGYTVSYPYTWQAQVSKDGTTWEIEPQTRRASVMIYVAEPMTAEDAAKRWIMSLGTYWSEITVLENKPMEGSWDWYLSYDYEAQYGLYHGEAYFKQTEKHLYRLDTTGLKGEYSNYPFNTIISSFKLR